MLSVERFSQMEHSRQISNHVFRSRLIPKYINYDGHLFMKNLQNLMYISKMHKDIEKNIIVSEINPSELVALNCFIQEENTCHRQSMC